MNLKDNFLFFFCLFPIFVFKSNFNKTEVFIIFSIFLILILVNVFFLNFLKKKNQLIKIFYLSLILVFGFDNHLGLFNGIVQSNISFFFKYFEIIYIPALLILFLVFFIISIIYVSLDQNKITSIFLITIFTLFVFNIFDNTKSYTKIPYFQKNINKNFKQNTLVIIWDEMSGLNSLSSKTSKGQMVNQNFIDLFEKYNFNYYTNAYSISDNSVGSLTSLINFEENIENINAIHVVKSNNYFSEYEIKKNLFFEKFKSISVIQNIHINYCNNPRVKKCYQYNPLDLKILDVSIDPISNIISSWSLNGSIIGKVVWRSLKQMNLILSTLEPEGEKLFIKNILDYSKRDLISNKFDLVFMHLLVPHKPYGFDSKCNYDIKLSNLNKYFNVEENIHQHNIERDCVIKLMDNYFKLFPSLSNYRIIILSDHGSRITKDDVSSLSTIFAFKDYKNKFSTMIDDKKSIQALFKEINYE
tara:strand:+ start:845 stop:2260 length:1416 start_codon:yes stop_codon:yes gene_type:complete